MRLQGVVRGQNVKRQTMNAMKQMQLLVRVQSQIQSRRIQMLETQSLHHGPNHKDIIDSTALGKLNFTQAVSYYYYYCNLLISKFILFCVLIACRFRSFDRLEEDSTLHNPS